MKYITRYLEYDTNFLYIRFMIVEQIYNNMDTEGTVKKRRKSVVLAATELRRLKKFREKFNTAVECSEALGIDRAVMLRVLLVGSGSPETIEKIRAVVA